MISVLSLFSGIGLFDLGVLAALEEAGLDPILVAQVETDAFCRRVLARHFPGAYRAITCVRHVHPENTPWADLVIGGFPCQDVSTAGKRVGLSGARSGLWWEFRRIVDEVRPRAVLVENVASGVRDWLGPVRCSLEAMGYRTYAIKIGADDVGAPHERKRVFVLAHANSERQPQQERSVGEERGWSCNGGQVAIADGERRREGAWGERDETGWCEPEHGGEVGHASGLGLAHSPNGDAPPQRRLDRGSHGCSDRLDATRWPAGRDEEQFSWEPPRTIGWQRDRRARLKALGNAVTPQQARDAMRWAVRKMGW